MAFFLRHGPLTSRQRFALDVGGATRVIRAAELGAYRAAEDAIAIAQEQAQSIIDDARAAYEAERTRGYEEGRALAHAEAGRHMIEQVVRANQYVDRVEAGVVDAVVSAVRRVVEGFDDRDRAFHLVRGALAVVRTQKQVTLRLNPEHCDDMLGRVRDLLGLYPGIAMIDVVPDERLGRGSCVVETEIGVVEAGTDAQLAAIESAFRNSVAGAGR